MNEKPLTQLEGRIERLVEGVFTSIFGKKVQAHDIALQLARSMENSLRYSPDDERHPVAPDFYVIRFHPDTMKQWNANPTLTETLSDGLSDFAAQCGYSLHSRPTIRIVADSALEKGSVSVRAKHTKASENSTQSMQPIRTEDQNDISNPPQLIINGNRIITLEESFVSVGRSDQNQIILDDPSVSRQHIQIRRRFGFFTLFDVNSRGGTYVNNIRVLEHQLQSGDVIRLGNTQIVYVSGGSDNEPPHTTQSIDPIET
ncbi:MAG: FHA domain-containing protein [Anaerolineae bacterium]|nr:FHA domain-containing protein [Anaerolineae bacterium]